MLAEMGIIRNGITSNNTDLTEFKRNTAQVQQQMQSQISELRDFGDGNVEEGLRPDSSAASATDHPYAVRGQ